MKNTINQFREDLKPLLAELSKKYGAEISSKNASYSEDSFDLKINFQLNPTNGKSIEQANFEKYCRLYGLKESDYLMQRISKGKCFELYGLNPSAPKNSALIRDCSTKKLYKCNIVHFKTWEQIESI